MATLSDFERHVGDLLAPVGPVRLRRMFGGSGIYAGDTMFALIAHDELYLKVDDLTRARFEAAGSVPFTYEGKGKPVQMSYWSAPEEVFDDPDALEEWARLALEAARRGKAAKGGKGGQTARGGAARQMAGRGQRAARKA